MYLDDGFELLSPSRRSVVLAKLTTSFLFYHIAYKLPNQYLVNTLENQHENYNFYNNVLYILAAAEPVKSVIYK